MTTPATTFPVDSGRAQMAILTAVQGDLKRVSLFMEKGTRGGVLSIIIPAYNETELLSDSVSTAAAAAEQAGCLFEIIIVDDCSEDGTAQLSEELANVNPRVKAIHNETNLGLGGAYREGLAAAGGEFVTWLAADNSQPPGGLADVYREIGTSDMIIPYVLNPEVRSRIRRLISWLFTCSVNILFGLKVPYYNAPAVHRTSFVRAVGVGTDSFCFQAEIIVNLMRAGKSTKYVGIELTDRSSGKSKAFRVKNILGVVVAILAMLKRRYFGRPTVEFANEE